MARSPNQKLKLLYLMQLLLEKSDENHVLTVQEMIDALAKHDISAERKSIYDDLEALRTYGPCPIHRKTFLKKFYGEK